MGRQCSRCGLAPSQYSTTMPEPIIFYDIPGVGKAKAWSPNTWKTR